MTTEIPESPSDATVAHSVTMAYRQLQADVDRLLELLGDRAAVAHADYVEARDEAGQGIQARDEGARGALYRSSALRMLWHQADETATMARTLLGRDGNR